MNTLQFWLGVVGAVVIVALVAHYVWQTRRTAAAPRWREPTPSPVSAASAARGAQEPSFGPAPTTRGPALEPRFDEPPPADVDLPVLDEEIARPVVGEAAPSLAPSVAAHPVSPAASSSAAAAPRRAPDGRVDPEIGLPPLRRHAWLPRIDALIDGIASLGFEGRLSGQTLLQHLPPTRRAGAKPFLIEARDVASGEWESPQPDAWYDEVQAGVQLANRLGPINEIEYSEFVQKIQAFADAIGAMPDFPDMLDVVARGRELDAFASGHDAQLAMRLRARKAAWPIGWVAQHAARHGFVPGVTAGRLVLPSAEEGAPPMLALQFDAQAAMSDNARDAQVTEITLMFDVPQTPASDEPYNAWCAAGQALSIALDAQVSDDQDQPLLPSAFPQIGADLAQLYAELAERDLAAGSLAARRLFS